MAAVHLTTMFCKLELAVMTAEECPNFKTCRAVFQ